ncbi:MAG: translation initiation factor eIF-2B [Candidatus Dojkabacteria bacterium]|jgi:ribose 1,5-bisphosphate isomerase|nr:translation initiation factor eIF-2B [Candidatus Dojkabacteria bacterium]MDD2270574.1 translation initiation factor eIF-2B [Candidatus Dojkabacteria bacterium]
MKYPRKIEKIRRDIASIKIQGATNVAIATFEGMKIALKSSLGRSDNFLKEILEVGAYLAYARPNEPLAQNGILYVKHFFTRRGGESLPSEQKRDLLEEVCDDFLLKISNAKHRIDELNTPKLKHIDHILTHCHSSTVVRLIQGISEEDNDFTAVCTETRPRYQGRITAKELVEAGIDTTLITDGAAESFVIGRGSKPVSAVFIGCDAITMQGYCINKIGSWGIAMSAYQSGKPVYVVTPLLKIDRDTAYHEIEIEIREDQELWKGAPKGLEIYNPAFEVVDAGLITGFITEYGIIKPSNIGDTVKREYPWLFVN